MNQNKTLTEKIIIIIIILPATHVNITNVREPGTCKCDIY